MTSKAKFHKEVMRVVFSARDRLADLYEPLVRRRYDRHFDRNVRIAAGQIATGDRVAVLVLYQPEGVAASTLLSLDHLIRHGFSPWVVANGGLPQPDGDRLLPLVATLIQRPNYGHDFGGYRDGIRVLDRAGHRPSELLIMNDSVWFPLQGDSTILDRLMQPETDIGGAMFDRKSGRRHQGHFESYMLRVGEGLLSGPDFWRFWQDYPVSSIRRKVLRRGEKGFTTAMRAAGARIGALASRELFIARMSEQDDAFLHLTLRYAAYDDPDDLVRAQDIGVPGDAEFRSRALAHIRKVAESASLQEAFVYAAMTLFELPLLKKRMRPSTVAMRRRFCEAVEAGHLPMPDRVIWEEIRARTPGSQHSP